MLGPTDTTLHFYKHRLVEVSLVHHWHRKHLEIHLRLGVHKAASSLNLRYEDPNVAKQLRKAWDEESTEHL